MDDFQRQLDNRDGEISSLNHRLDRSGDNTYNQNEIVSMLKKENEAYKSENRLLRDKIGTLNSELDSLAK